MNRPAPGKFDTRAIDPKLISACDDETASTGATRSAEVQLPESRMDVLLEALAVWDENYRHGEDLPPVSLGITDPELLDELRGRIDKQKRLYALLRIAALPAVGTTAPCEVLPTFPGYECIRKIGEGGMGIVYEARDRKLGRVVAIKTIADGRYASREQLDRFLAEAEAVARLKHPNVITIYSIGEHEGRPYFALEYADGGSLAQRVAEGPMATRPAAELVERLACAVHAAHQAGIVHRDLKPSNILLTAEGTPKVSDFGLAKLVGSDSARTLSGQVLGSPSYMAPEQAEGQAKHVGPLADVYALGAILYQALTGKPPFLGESQLETLKLVTSTEPVPPRQSRPDIPQDVETICLKCLQKEPPKRYDSASALADDLCRFLEGRPIVARPLRIWERSWRWCRRNPKLAAISAVLAATVLLAATVFTGLTYRHNLQLREEIGRTQAKADEARRNYREARSTIGAMLARLSDRRLSGSPRHLDLLRELREDALAFYDRILGQIDSPDPVVRSDTADASVEASVLQSLVGRNDEAGKQLRRALSLVESLRAERPDDLDYMVLQSKCLMRLSAYVRTAREGDEAISAGRESIVLAERVVHASPENAGFQELLAACHNNYANAMRHDNAAEAKIHHQKAIEIRERIDPPRLPGVSRMLAGSLTNLGVILWGTKEYSQAEASFRRAEDILRTKGNDVREPVENVAISVGQLNVNWGGMLLQLGRFSEVIAKADSDLNQLESYLRIEPHDEEARNICLKVHGNRAYALGESGRHREAADDWARVVELSPEPVSPAFRIGWAHELIEAGETARGFTQIQLVKSMSALSGEDRYNLACCLCLYAVATRKDSRISPDQRVRLVETQILDALQWLKSAADAGLFQNPAMRDSAAKDPDLMILAGRNEFQQLIKPPRAMP
jgi:eukaryotic-like serine/threonine-protein kinase